MKRKLLSMLALLMMAVTGAWADADVTWNSSNVSDLLFWGGAPDPDGSYTKEGVTLRGNAVQCDASWQNWGGGQEGIMFAMNAPGGYTFTAPDGKKFTKIEITATTNDGWYTYAYFSQLESGWPAGEAAADDFNSTLKFTWTGSAASVNLATTLESFGPSLVSSIDFYFEAPAGPTVVASGNCGTTGHESEVTWSLTSDGVLTISGTGAMANYTAADKQPWYSDVSSITTVVVEAGVTHIGNSSFRDFTSMTSVSLPDGLETIGNHAFNGCTNASFTSITIPASVTSTGTYIFNGCTYLATVEFSAGSNLTGIGDYAFRNCSALGSIEIPADVTSIGNYAFQNCTNASFTSITIPASVTSIGNKAFDGCTYLATITLNSNPYLSGTTVYPSTATVTMNLTGHLVESAYWMTFYNNRFNFVADENTQVFKAELSGTSITLHEVTDKIVTKSTAVILKSTGNPEMTKTDDSSTNSDTNSLNGVISSSGRTVTDPSTTYVLNNGSQGVGFYKLAGGNTLGAYKAYLLYDGSGAGARAFIGFGETTGVNEVRGQMEDVRGEYYDLQGRRVVNPTKGLYIVNGKKVFINK